MSPSRPANPTPERVDTVTRIAPLADKAALVDLTDDSSQRAAVYGVSNIGPKDGSGAWNNDLTSGNGGFGGYASPHAVYAFTEPRVVNGIGVLNQPHGSRDRSPAGFALYGGSDTNNWVELGVWKKLPVWSLEGEWRRFPVANTNAYPFYKFAFRGSLGANSPWVTAQEVELYHIPTKP